MRPKLIGGRRVDACLRRCLLPLYGEEGIALIMALGIMLVLTIALTTVIFLTAAGARDAHRTNAGQSAYALAEAGVNDALAILDNAYSAGVDYDTQDHCLLHDPGTGTDPGTPFYPTVSTSTCSTTVTTPFTATPDSSQPNDTVSYWGSLRLSVPGVDTAWIIHATGSVPNPTGPSSSPVTRTVTVKVPVTIPQGTGGGNGTLDWVYSGKDVTTPNSVGIESPMYVDGNVTLANGASVHGPLYATGNVSFTSGSSGAIDGTNCPPVPLPKTYPGCLNIGGNLSMPNKNNIVGLKSGKTVTPITDAHIAGSCSYNGTTQSKCGNATAPANPWTDENVYATTHDNTFPPANNPFPTPLTTTDLDPALCKSAPADCLDFGKWYTDSSPGPLSPCVRGSLPQTVFDTDTARNNSVSTSFDLTPSTPYSCWTPGGELSWDPSGGKYGGGLLTVRGTIYIDGSAYISSTSGAYSYTGLGTIWLSGAFEMQSSNMCAVLKSKNSCDTTTADWDPTVAALGIVANGNGYGTTSSPGYVPSGDSVYMTTQTTFQGIMGGTNSVQLDNNSQVQGPIICVNGSLMPGQSLSFTFPPLPFSPTSSPGNPPPPASLLAPTQYGGG